MAEPVRRASRPCQSELDPLLRLHPGGEVVLDLAHLGHEVGGSDEFRLGVAARHHDVQVRPAPAQGLHHLRQRLDDPKNIVVLAGYQADGTRGRQLKDGAESIRIHGRDIPVRARVEEVSGLSAHADADELMRWLEPLKTPPRMTYLNHGEPHAAQAFAERLKNERGYRCTIPRHHQSFELK